KKEVGLRTQLDALDAEIVDRESCLALADDLASFLARLREAAQSSSIPNRQKVLRLLVKDVLVGRDRVLVRHSIPSSRRDPPPGLLLRGRRQHAALWRAALSWMENGLVHEPGLQPLVQNGSLHGHMGEQPIVADSIEGRPDHYPPQGLSGDG